VIVKKLLIAAAATGLVLVSIGFTMLEQNQESPPAVESTARAKLVLYKTATCGCCGKWAEHMEAAGFEVETQNLSNEALTAVKNAKGVHSKFWSCHTAVVDGYLIEGHVPAEQILKMLEEKPEIAGLAVPGMPVGSPGMEVPDKTQHQEFNVLAFQADGESSVFAHVEAGK
jgi:hypothetical protein